MSAGNPYHGSGGRFASGPGAACSAHAHVKQAAAKLTAAEGKRVSSEQAHHGALAKAKTSLAAAKAARAKAQRSPTEANVKAWHQATKKAIADRAAAEKHGATAAKAATAHEKARTTHALAHAQLREQQRKAQPRPEAPKAVELHPRGVGFERVHGEGETGAFGQEQFGPAAPAPLRPGFHPGESSEAYQARRYRELYGDVTGPRAATHQAPSAHQQAERDRAHQERMRRALHEQEVRRATERARPLTSLPGVAAVSLGLPQAAATIGLAMPRRDSLSWHAVRCAMSTARAEPSAANVAAARAAIALARLHG